MLAASGSFQEGFSESQLAGVATVVMALAVVLGVVTVAVPTAGVVEVVVEVVMVTGAGSVIAVAANEMGAEPLASN